MTGDTLFSKIIRREIPAAVVFENEDVIAFNDIYPKAPVHILVVPKKVIPDIASAKQEDKQLLGELLLVAAEVAKKEGIHESGYRLVVNNGQDAGQAVPHIHIHVLGGRKMEWPPG